MQHACFFNLCVEDFLHLTCVVGTFLSSGDILIVLHNFKGLSEDWDLVLMLS